MTQDEYITILFDDLGFNLAQRKDWLEQRFGQRYTDELPVSIRSRIIGMLKELKEDRNFPNPDDEDED